MGSKVSRILFVGALLSSATVLAQPGPLPAADFAKQGSDLYNAGDYAGAVAPLEKAVELEPNNFDYRYMLAQSYRQSGHCDKALPLYKALVDVAPPAQKAEVETNMGLCPETSVAPPPAPPPETPTPPPPPEPIVTASTTGGGISGANMALLVGAGVGIGAGAVLLLAGHNDAGDAESATSVAKYDEINNRKTREYLFGTVGLAAGVGLAVVAVIRIRHAKEADTTISFKPRSGGGSFVLERTW